jgi:hypothetical protein
VDKTTYDESIAILEDAVSNANTGDYEKFKALKRLKKFTSI